MIIVVNNRPAREGGHMSWKKFSAAASIMLLVFVSACNLPAITNGGIATNPPVTVPIDTQVAQMVAATLAAQTVLANSLASPTSMPTDTPQFTFTPSLTPTFTYTSTSTIPMVSVSVNTNCRSGPGDPYSILGVLVVGQTAEVVGHSPLNDNWIVKLPGSAVTCWLWAQYATVTGNTAGLPVVNPPPTPTPTGSFNVVYISTQTCSGSYGIKFQITNTGSVTWESNQVKATNLNTNATKTSTYDTFPNYSSSDCSLLSSDQNLAPGEVGTTSVLGFADNPAGNKFSAIIQVCSQNGLAGICLQKTITFTP